MRKQTIALVDGTGNCCVQHETPGVRRLVPADFAANLFHMLPLNAEWQGKLDELMNDRYPSIRTTTVREYVAREGL